VSPRPNSAVKGSAHRHECANLDALWDRLSTDMPRPVHLVWESADVSRAAMGLQVFDQIESIVRRTVDQDAAFGRTDRFTYERA
jgi:ribonuclease inhibitor